MTVNIHNRNILWLSYSFPPMTGSESIQSAGYAKYISRLGWRCFVVTNKPSNALYVDDIFQEVLRAVFLKRVSHFNGVVKNMARMLNRVVVRLPGSCLDWIYPAYREALNTCREEQIAVIYTRAQPQICSLVGLLLKRELGLPWISHISDLWVGSPYTSHATWPHHVINSWLEKEVISKADFIIFTAERTKQIYEQRYSAFVSKFKYIPNAFDPELIEEKRDIELAICNSDPITIGHIGSLYSHRTPVTFLERFFSHQTYQAWVQRVCFEFVGHCDKAIKEKMYPWIQKGLVKIEPAVEYRNVLSRLQQYDICLLLDALIDGGEVFMPSKLAEYLGAGKPVIAVTSKNSESRDIVLRAGGIACDPRDVTDFDLAMIKLAEIVSNPQDINVSVSVRNSLSMPICAGQLETVFLNAIKNEYNATNNLTQ
jgi:glycosyltransferase involved in cell wall biosynthesis